MSISNHNDPVRRDHNQAITIRHATHHDIATLLHLIRLKASFDGFSRAIEATPEKLEITLFSEQPLAFVLLAESGSQTAGFATYHHTYSTFLARAGLWLDDLYICEKFRAEGIGKALIQKLCCIAEQIDGGRIDWTVSTTNERALGFYQHMNATIRHNMLLCRLDQDAIQHHATHHYNTQEMCRVEEHSQSFD